MDTSKGQIFDKLKSNECVNKFKELELNTVMLFGSIITDEFEDYSDIDIAVLSEKDINLTTVLELEEYLEKFLGREVDVINLRDKNLDLNMKVTIYDDSMIIYSCDDLRLYNAEYIKTELLYKENESFRFFRERDVIFDE